MTILIAQFHPTRPPGRLGHILASNAHKMDIRQLDRGDDLPTDLDEIDAILTLDSPGPFQTLLTQNWVDPLLTLINQAHTAQQPVIGIGSGAQLIAHALGGTIAPDDNPPLGWTDLRLTFHGTVETVLAGHPWQSTQFLTKTDRIETLPPAATPLATSPGGQIQSFKVALRTYAFHHHLELETKHFDAPGLIPDHPSKPALSEVQRQTSEHFQTYDRLATRIVQTLVETLLPASILHRS